MLDFSFMLAVKVNEAVGTGFSQSYNSFVRCWIMIDCDCVGAG